MGLTHAVTRNNVCFDPAKRKSSPCTVSIVGRKRSDDALVGVLLKIFLNHLKRDWGSDFKFRMDDAVGPHGTLAHPWAVCAASNAPPRALERERPLFS